jgi:hypothetical protein
VHSVLRRTSQPVAIHRLDSCGLPQGSNAFTVSRFLVPWLMGFQGRAIFADAADMLCLGDIAQLDALFDARFAVQVVPHAYQTQHPVKYIGTQMEAPNLDYQRKNWASLMLMNCAHEAWQSFDAAHLSTAPKLETLQFANLNGSIGRLPDFWNRIVDEGQPIYGAQILHWTAGIPGFQNYADAPGAELWRAELAQMMEHA